MTRLLPFNLPTYRMTTYCKYLGAKGTLIVAFVLT